MNYFWHHIHSLKLSEEIGIRKFGILSQLLFFNFKFIYVFIFERGSVNGEGAERERQTDRQTDRQNLKQGPGSELSAQGLMFGLNS